MTPDNKTFETRDAFGRLISIQPSKMTAQGVYIASPSNGVSLGRGDAEKAARTLLAASGSRFRVVDPLLASYYHDGAPTGYVRPKAAPSASLLREALRLAVDDGDLGESAETTTRRARAYADYLSEGK